MKKKIQFSNLKPKFCHNPNLLGFEFVLKPKFCHNPNLLGFEFVFKFRAKIMLQSRFGSGQSLICIKI